MCTCFLPRSLGVNAIISLVIWYRARPHLNSPDYFVYPRPFIVSTASQPTEPILGGEVIEEDTRHQPSSLDMNMHAHACTHTHRHSYSYTVNTENSFQPHFENLKKDQVLSESTCGVTGTVPA